MGVDRALVRFDRHPVERIQQLSAREHAAGLAHEGRQELELRGGEVDGATCHARAHLRQVHLDVAGAQDLGAGGGAAGPAEDRAHAGHQLLRTERLDQVVVGAQLEADDAV